MLQSKKPVSASFECSSSQSMMLSNFDTISVELTVDGVCNLTLNRPAVHNAFDELMIQELIQALEYLHTLESLRILTIQGTGKSFCAGADLKWMKRTSQYNRDENFEDARQLANMFRLLHGFAKPTVAFAHGNVFGGGVGLVASCDIAIAADTTVFSLSEVKLGLIPSVISPYVVNAIGARSAHRYFLTGERFDATIAQRIGLIHESCTDKKYSDTKAKLVNELLTSAPDAQKISKRLIQEVLTKPISAEIREKTAKRIADVRASEEGREGVLAFLNKELPSWRKK